MPDGDVNKHSSQSQQALFLQLRQKEAPDHAETLSYQNSSAHLFQAHNPTLVFSQSRTYVTHSGDIIICSFSVIKSGLAVQNG